MTSALFSFSLYRAQAESVRYRARGRACAALDATTRRLCSPQPRRFAPPACNLVHATADVVSDSRDPRSKPSSSEWQNLEASGADKIDALDSLVDSLAVEDSPAQLLDSDPEQTRHTGV